MTFFFFFKNRFMYNFLFSFFSFFFLFNREHFFGESFKRVPLKDFKNETQPKIDASVSILLTPNNGYAVQNQ